MRLASAAVAAAGEAAQKCATIRDDADARADELMTRGALATARIVSLLAEAAAEDAALAKYEVRPAGAEHRRPRIRPSDAAFDFGTRAGPREPPDVSLRQRRRRVVGDEE